MNVETWLALEGDDLTEERAAMLRRIYAEHGPIDGEDLSTAVDLERLRLITEATAAVAADVRATISDPFEFVVMHQAEGSIGLSYRGATDHSGFTLYGDGPDELLVAVADSAQDIVMHEHWIGWPVCPAHSVGLHPELRPGAVWVCRSHDHVVASIGHLAQARPPAEN